MDFTHKRFAEEAVDVVPLAGVDHGDTVFYPACVVRLTTVPVGVVGGAGVRPTVSLVNHKQVNQHIMKTNPNRESTVKSNHVNKEEMVG